MEKERRITAPDGCEIENVEIVEGVAVVTFREKERKLPKSWEEFCKIFPDYTGEYFIVPDSSEKIGQVLEISEHEKRTYKNTELLPDRDAAEAVLALCQLIQLRNAYNSGWVPDWNDVVYVIEFREGKIDRSTRTIVSSSPLYFLTDDLRDEFLRNFRPLIEKLKPLYGIKEGGEE